FAGLTGLTLGTVAMGDWKAFQDFKVALEIVGREVGVILTPLIKELTRYIMDFAGWLNNLSPEQQKMIASLVKWGAVLSGIGFILPKLIYGFVGLYNALSKLGALNLLGSGVGRVGLAAGAGYLAGNYLADKLTNKAQSGLE